MTANFRIGAVVAALSWLAVLNGCEGGSRLGPPVVTDLDTGALDTGTADVGEVVEDVADTSVAEDGGPDGDGGEDVSDGDGPEDADDALDAADTADTADAADSADTSEPGDTEVDTSSDADPDASSDINAGPPPCRVDGDCATPAALACRRAACDVASGACVTLPDSEGVPCDDGNACTTGGRCAGGACRPEGFVTCADANPCTDDRCDPAVGCRYDANFASCDDADPCTVADRCLGGACHGGTPACDDGNPCTLDSCAAGVCSHSDDDALPCSDGSACTAGDHCVAGLCAAGTGDGCEDGNPCTATTCAADGDSCVVTPKDGADCDDGSVCTVDDTCAGGACVSGAPIDCGGDPSCIDWTCDPVTGCALVAIHPTHTCSDGDACTVNDHCDAAGACVPGTPRDCEDNNPCTVDSCDSVFGCRRSYPNDPCDDGDACTVDDRCSFSTCRGTTVACNDGDPCSLDRCDALTGCEILPGGVPTDDGVACTVDACTAATGVTHTPDSALCALGEACLRVGGCAVVPPVVLFARVLPGTGSDPAEAGYLVLANATDAAHDLRGAMLVRVGDGATAAIEPVGGGPLILGPRALMPIEKAGGALGLGYAFGEAADDFSLELSLGPFELVDAEGAVLDTFDPSPAAAGPAVGPTDFPVVAGLPLSLGTAALAVAASASANDSGAVWCSRPIAPHEPAPDCARARLNEVWLAGGGGDRWVEVHLPFGGSMAGLGVRIVGPSGAVLVVVPLSGRMPLGATALVRDGAAGVSLPQEASGSAQLLRGGALLDVYGFGTLTASVDSASGYPLTEGGAGPAQSGNAVAQRASDGVDSDDNAADWVTVPGGSPGALNAP